MSNVRSAGDVFINCPFDDDFAPGFRALVFAVLACGFRARCAREMADGTETRIDKLYNIIEQSRFSVHDLSRTELDPLYNLPRFNMPLELGIFLGAKRFGDSPQKMKRCLILDTEPYRFQKFISDLAGMDVTPYGGDVRRIVGCTRDWLATVSKRKSIPDRAFVISSFDRFTNGLPAIAEAAGVKTNELIFADLERFILAWVKEGQGILALK
jgi:hypothetical protein